MFDSLGSVTEIVLAMAAAFHVVPFEVDTTTRALLAHGREEIHAGSECLCVVEVEKEGELNHGIQGD